MKFVRVMPNRADERPEYRPAMPSRLRMWRAAERVVVVVVGLERGKGCVVGGGRVVDAEGDGDGDEVADWD